MRHPPGSDPAAEVERRKSRSAAAHSGRVVPPAVALLLALAPAHPLLAQGRAGRLPATSPDVAAAVADTPAAAIDTLILLRQELFTDGQRERSVLPRILGALHVTTRPSVIQRELLLEVGEPYDSALAAETERNLRARGLFREVEVDTLRVDGRLAAVVRTRDAWSLLPRLELGVASDGTLAGAVGATETNLAGTGNVLQAVYIREVDRDGLVLGAGIPRIGPSRAGLGAVFRDLSDRNSAAWSAGIPFRALSDSWSLVASGEAFAGRVLQFRSESAAPPDTVEWQRRAVIQRLDWAWAPRASPAGYLRVGMTAEVRREEYFLRALLSDPSALPIPDTVYGLAGAWGELRRADFHTLRYLNGFTEEDQDVSRLLFVGLRLAPGAWGYGETGVGPRLLARAGRRFGELLLKGEVNAQALFGSPRDSGRVQARATAALKPGRRHATFLSLAAGVQRDPPPGGEVDLGFRVPPRLWPPHAFTGTRSASLTVEHRWYAWDGVFDLFGIGLGAFADYGGAWFQDQDPRAGGNAGLSLLVGWPLRAIPILTELAAGYRFGGGIGESDRTRWAATLGTGLVF